jgi:hypothetical protein
LRLVTGESTLSPARKASITRKANKLAKDKDVQVFASDRPLIAIVSAKELDPEKTLLATDYVDDVRGRSRIFPELNALHAAKGWYRDMIRLARSEGYTDMKKFFKSDLVTTADKRLFHAVGALIDWESKIKRPHGPG